MNHLLHHSEFNSPEEERPLKTFMEIGKKMPLSWYSSFPTMFSKLRKIHTHILAPLNVVLMLSVRDKSTILLSDKELTHYQTTNFRLFQT